MQKDIEELQVKMSDKVDYNIFDEEINNFKLLFNQLASSGKEFIAPIVKTGPSISSKDLNDLKEAMKKITDLEAKVKGLSLEQILRRL